MLLLADAAQAARARGHGARPREALAAALLAGRPDARRRAAPGRRGSRTSLTGGAPDDRAARPRPRRAARARARPRAAADHLGQRLRAARRPRTRRRSTAHLRATRSSSILDGGPPTAVPPRPSSTARRPSRGSCGRARSRRRVSSRSSRRPASPHRPRRRTRRPAARPVEAGPRSWEDSARRAGRTAAPAGRSRRADDHLPERAGIALASIADVDPELWAAMLGERRRQHDKIELIASENYVSAAVMEAQGSWLTNKYAEGLPGKRYYGGCEYVDIAERLAQERALALFPGAEHVNVQPHSGRPGQHGRLLQRPRAGRPDPGHEPRPRRPPDPRHGPQLLAAGCTRSTPYGVRQDTERIDYDALEAQAHEVRPKLIVGGASAYPRIWDFERMADIAHGVGALLFVDMAHIAGLVAAGVHPSPFPHADLVTTTTHKTLRGPRGGMIFSRHELPAVARSRPTSRRSRARSRPRVDRTVFPGIQGGPLMHVIAGKAVAFKLAAGEDFRSDQRRTVENAAVIAETVASLGARVVSGGTDNHLAARRRDAARRDRQGGRAPARRDRDHRQQERDPVRRAARRTRRPASASGRRPRRRAASARTRCAQIGRIIVDAIRRPRRRGGPGAPRAARSARSSAASRCRACPPREAPSRPASLRDASDGAMTFIPTLGEALPLRSSWRSSRRRSLALVLTPLVRRLVVRFEDGRPARARRVNIVPIPRGGGIAVATAFIAVVVGRPASRTTGSCRLLDARARSTRPSSSALLARRRRRPPRSARSTTSSTCAPAGSSPASSRSRVFAVVARDQRSTFIANPFGGRRSSRSTGRSPSGSRSSGSSG